MEEREREKHQFVVPPLYALIDSCMCPVRVLYVCVKPATLAYQDDSLTK